MTMGASYGGPLGQAHQQPMNSKANQPENLQSLVRMASYPSDSWMYPDPNVGPLWEFPI